MLEWGGVNRAPTADEATFATRLSVEVDLWLHSDAEGPWLCVSRDVLGAGGGISHTLRLDFDGTSIVGGVSPSALNWDDGVRAKAAGIEGTGFGEVALSADVEALALAATAWFTARVEER